MVPPESVLGARGGAGPESVAFARRDPMGKKSGAGVCPFAGRGYLVTVQVSSVGTPAPTSV